MTASERALTYEDLHSFPEDNLRRELIGGELIVTASPSTRHQLVSGRLYLALHAYTSERNDVVLYAPMDVYLSESDVVEPDLLVVRSENRERIEERLIRGSTLKSVVLPGFDVPVDEVLGEA